MISFLRNLPARIPAEKWAPLLSLAAVLIVNARLLATFFYGEDFLNFYHIASVSNPLEYIFSSMGYHLYIFRNIIFYGMFKLFGVNSIVFFSVVLLTHLCCAFILYKILHLLTGKASLAAAGATIWGICPVNYGTLAWYTVYGHLLVGFFFLLFLYDLFRIAKGKLSFSTGMAIRWSIYLFASAASLVTGLAIACLSPVAIVMILWENDKKWKIAASMLPVIACLLLLFIFKDAIYYYFSGSMPNSNLVALSSAVSLHKIILEMFIRTIAYSIYCMASFPLLFVFPPTVYPAAAIFISIPVVILFIGLFFRSREYKRHYAVFCMFFLGLIGMIAYGRAPSNYYLHVPMIKAALSLRYYYIILMIVMIILSLMADQLTGISPKISKVVGTLIFMAIVMAVYPSTHLAKKMDYRNESETWRKMYFNTVADIEKTVRACPEGSSVFIDNTLDGKIPILPGKAAIFVIKYPNNTLEGRKIYFVEKNCRLADKLINQKKWSISSLIVSACRQNEQN